MATVLDALTVTLALDPAEFTKGQKTAVTAFRKTKEEATAAGKDIEGVGRSVGESLSGIATKALAMFAVFAGARSIKDFVRDLGLADSALGRLAANLGTTPDRLSAITSAVERNGGSAAATAGSLRSLSDSFEELKNTGNSGVLPMLQRLQGQGGHTIDMLHGVDKALPGIVENLTAMKNRGDAVGANWFGRQLGIDDETVNFLEQGWPKVQAEIEKSRRLGVVTPESAKAGQEMIESLRALRQEAIGLGRDIFVQLSPQINGVLHAMAEWIEKNKAWIESGLKEAIEGFAGWLRQIDWKGVLDGITAFVKGADDAAKAVGGWKVIGEALLALWVGSKFTAALAALGRFRSLLALPIPPWALALLGITGSAVAIGDAAKGAFDQGFNRVTPGATTPDIEKNEHMSVWGRMKRIWKSATGQKQNDFSDEQPMTGKDGLRMRGRKAREGRADDGTDYKPTGKETNTRLAAQRAHFFEELDKNPQLQRDVIKTASMESRGSPESMTAVIESMVNRSQMNGYHSLNQAIHSGFYGPVNRGGLSGALSGKDRADGEAALRNVRGGSNYIGYRTDQGMLTDPGARVYMQEPDHSGHRVVHGENYFYMGPKGRAWAKRQEELDRQPVKTPPMMKAGPKAVAPTAPAKEPSALQTMWKGVPGAADAARLPSQAAAVQASYHTANDNSQSNSHTQIGAIHVSVPGGDSHEIAKNIGPAIERHSYAVHGNYGTI